MDAMIDPIYFLRTRLPAGEMANGYTWALTLVKFGAVGGYLCFRTRELADMVSQALAGECASVSSQELDHTHWLDFERREVVLFESATEVQKMLASRRTYPYEKHVYRYVTSTGALEDAA